MNLDSRWIFLVAPALVSSYLTISFVYSYRTDISLRANCSQFLFGSDEDDTSNCSSSSSSSSSVVVITEDDKELFERQQLKNNDQYYRRAQFHSHRQQQQQQQQQRQHLLKSKRSYQFKMADSSSSSSGVAIVTDEMDLENTIDFATTTTTTDISSTPTATLPSSTTTTSSSTSSTIPTLDDLTESEISSDSSVKLPIRFGIGELQGRRPYMEDRSTAVLGFGVGDANTATRCFFGVFDGHGGDAASSWCKQKMHTNLAKQPDFPDNLPSAMRLALLQTDREFLSKFPKSSLDDGSTVIFAVLELHSSRLVVANAGDSRGVLSRSGVATPLSDDHKPDRPDERARVEAHGGMVQQASLFGKFMGPYRVYTRVRTGGLAVSRGLGDGLLKQNDLVIAEPDIVDIHLAPGDEFMILATDGVWDVFSNQQVVDFVRKFYLEGSKDPTEIADLLVREAIQRGSLDNVTAIVVFFDANQQFTGEPPLPETNVSRLTLQEQKVISFTKSV